MKRKRLFRRELFKVDERYRRDNRRKEKKQIIKNMS